jgi:hypothetical protein
MKKYLEQSKQALNSMSAKVVEEFSAKMNLVKEVVSGLPIFVSSERTDKFDVLYDEKHYFVVPYRLSETGFSLHTMRCLPESVPEINDLPKRRIFHFPNFHYEALLREQMIQSAVQLSNERKANDKHTLERLADDIDSLDSKLTYGMLLVGGVAAVFNPLVGAGIAAKALLPGMGSLANKYGLRPVGEKLTDAQLKKAAKEAETSVIQQFSEANTLKVENPILQELELALRTTEDEHDPLVEVNLSNGSIPELGNERWRQLTEKAVYHCYQDVLKNKKLHKKAGLGPEDLRWLQSLFNQGR